MTSIYWTKIFY